MLIHGLTAFIESLGYHVTVKTAAGTLLTRIAVAHANGERKIIYLKDDTLLLYGGLGQDELSLADPDSLDNLADYLNRSLRD